MVQPFIGYTIFIFSDLRFTKLRFTKMQKSIHKIYGPNLTSSPAACDTILQNLKDFGRKEADYDRIFTGDLGYVGQSILFDLMRKQGKDIKSNHADCGMIIFDQQTQGTNSGGSGCGCAAVTLSSYILPRIDSGEWKRVLFVPTGALMSTVSYNEGESVPGIAHGIVLEHC